MNTIFSLTLGFSILSCGATMAMHGDDPFESMRRSMNSPAGQATFQRLRDQMNSPQGQATFQRLRDQMNNPAGQTTFQPLNFEGMTGGFRVQPGQGQAPFPHHYGQPAQSQPTYLPQTQHTHNSGTSASYNVMVPAASIAPSSYVTISPEVQREAIQRQQNAERLERERVLRLKEENDLRAAEEKRIAQEAERQRQIQTENEKIRREKEERERKVQEQAAQVANPEAPIQEVTQPINWKGTFTLANGMIVKRTPLGISLVSGSARHQSSKALILQSGQNINGHVLQNDINLTKTMTSAEFEEALARESAITGKTVE